MILTKQHNDTDTAYKHEDCTSNEKYADFILFLSIPIIKYFIHNPTLYNYHHSLVLPKLI